MANDVAWVDVLPSMRQFMPTLDREIGGGMAKAGRTAGTTWGQSFTAGATSGVEAASAKLTAARNKLADTTGQLRVAEAKLKELRESGKASASQLIAAEERVEKARRGVDSANGAVATSTRKVTEAQENAATASRRAGDGLAHAETQGSRLTRSWGGMVGVVGGVTAAWYGLSGAFGFVSGAIGAARDLNETVNKSNTIFGSAAAVVDDWAKTSARSVGLSRQAALEAAAGFGNMFTQLGWTSQEAAKLSTNVVQMSADLGSFNNLPTADVAERIGAAFRGEYDSLQLLIPNINAARVEQEAMSMTGKENAKALTAQEKAAAVLAIVQKDGTAAMGDFAKTSDGLANSQKILSAEWDNAKARLGELLLGPMTSIVHWTSNTLLPVLSGAWTEITGAFTAFAAAWRYNDGDITSSGLPGLFERIGYWARQAWDVLNGQIIPVLKDMGGWLLDNQWAIMAVVGALAAWKAAQLVATAASTAMGAVQFVTTASTYGLSYALTAGGTAARVYAAGQWLANASLLGFPLVWVVAAFAAVAAGLVLLWNHSETFRSVVTAVWEAVKSAISFAWESVLKPIFGFIVSYWTAVAEGVQWGWTNIIRPAWDAVSAGASWLWSSVLSPIFSAIGTAWSALSTGIQWAWQNIIQPVWSVLETIAKALAITLAVVVFGPILIAWKIMSEGVQWAWRNVIEPTWGAVQAGASWLWTNVLQPIFGWIGTAWSALATGVQWAWLNVVKPTWDAVSAGARWLWDNVLAPIFSAIGTGWRVLSDGIGVVYRSFIEPIFSAFGRLIETLRDGFRTGVDWIGRIWDELKEKLRAPVQWVIDVVWNDGLRSLWNTINNLWGGENLDRFRFAQGGVYDPGSARARANGQGAYATGGVLPGYTPGRDVHDFVSPTGGRLALSGGEAIMRPEWTRAIGAPTINYWNQLARQEGEAGLRRALQSGPPSRDEVAHFASGGIIDLPGWLDTAIDWVPGLGGVSDLIDKINSGSGFGGGLFGSGLLGMVKTIGKKLWEKAESLWGGGGDAAGGGGGPVPGGGGSLGSSTASIFAAVKRAFPEARLNSGYRPGDPGYHGRGKAADIGWMRAPGGIGNAFMARVNQWLYDYHRGSLAELIYNGTGDNRPNWWKGRNHPYSIATQLQHRNHVHAAVYDKGGIWNTGTLGLNLTGLPERVLAPEQDDYFRRFVDQTEGMETATGPRTVIHDNRKVYAEVDAQALARAMNQDQRDMEFLYA